MLSLKKRQRLRKYMSVFLAAAMITTFTPAEVFSFTAEDTSYPAALAADNEVSGEGHADQAATDEASVTIDGATLYYATLEEAFSAANGKTAAITMLNDAECIYTDSKNPCPLPISKGSVTLDMNGKTLSGKSYGTHGIVDVSGGSLSVQGEGKIIVTNTGLFCKGNGKLTVKDITLELVTGQFYAISGVQNNGGTVILNGVKMTGAASDGQIHQYSGNTTINDVTATGTVESQPNSVLYYNEGTLKINGGTFDKISVDSGNYGNIDAVSELLGDGCTYRHTDKTWATADELAAMEISNVTVEKIPLTIAPGAETSWYYNSAEHSLKMNAVPTTAGNEITYEWYYGDTKLDCTYDAYTIPKTTSAGSYTYTCKATCDGYTLSSEFTFEIKQSGTSIDNIKTYNGDTETDQFSAGDTITVKAEPTATGTAPKKAAARLRADPTACQMALFIGDMQVSEPVNKDGNGVYTMTVGASDVLLQGNKEPNTAVTLTAKFVGNDNMADASGTVNVTVSAAAKAEKGGNIIGYLDAASFEGTNSVFMQNAYAGSTITLLSDVQPDTSSKSGKTCSTMVNISCTLDLNGYDLSSSGIAVYVLPNGVLTVQDSSVSKTGQVISTADAAVENNGRLTLKDGTYSGTPAIKTAEGLSGILPSGADSYYAFYRDGKPVNIKEPENQKELEGTVTVKLCSHDGVDPASNNDGTHTLNCPCCGYNGTAEDCTYGDEYTTDETNHTKTCTECGYENIEAHTIKFTAESDINNIITLSEACDICGYKKELGTVAVTIPELTYGETDKSVTLTDIPVNCFVIFKVDDGSEFQNGDGDTEVSITLGELFGDSEMTAGEHKLKLTFVNADNKYSNECELTFTVKECPHESDVIETVSNNNGTHTLTCKRCGHTETVNCTYGEYEADGETNHKHACTACGYTVTEAHTTAKAENAATCEKKAVCDICGLEYGKLAAHNYSTEWQSDENDHWHECTVCHNDKKDITPHSWNSGIVTTEATEEAEGVKLFTCTVCGKTKTEKIDVLPHTHILAKTEAKAPTCVTAGNTEYWTCSKCHKYFSDENGTNEIALNDTVQAATGVHNYVDGVCTVCGGSDPNYSEPTETSPSETEPPVTDPTGTDPSVTEPPVTDPTGTDPSVTEPPVTDPTDTDPSVTEPVGDNDTTTEPPVTYPEDTTTEPSFTYTVPTFTDPPVIYPPYTPSTPAPAVTETAVQSGREQPFIQGDSGKSGWDAISDIISDTPDGGTVTVDMNNSSMLPKDIVSQIKGRDIDLVLIMKNKFVWTVNGTSVRSAKTVNMKVQRSVNISASTVEEYFGDLETVQIQLAHNGDFGFAAELSISLGGRYNGMTASSYCYKAGKFSFGDSAEIAEGSAKLKFDHASNWLIAITDTAAEDVSADAGISAKGDNIDPDKNISHSILSVILILGTAFICFRRSKQK